MPGPINRLPIVTLTGLLLCCPLRSQDAETADGPPSVTETAQEPSAEPGSAPETEPAPEAAHPAAGTDAPAARMAPIAREAPLALDPPPLTDRYPTTVDNFAGRGLLNLLDPFPLAQLHLQLPVNTLRVMKETDGSFEIGFRWANNYVIEDNVIVDAETYSIDLGGWYALRSDFYVGASISVLARDGGILDGFVDGFHDTFGLTDGGRSKRSNNKYLIEVTDDNGETRELNRGIGLGDLVLKSHWNLNLGDKWLPAVALETFLTLPTSTDGFGSSGVDLGLSVSFYKTVYEDLHLYAMVGGTMLTNRRTEGIKYEKSVLQATLGIEYVLLKDLSVVLQHMSYSALLREPSPLEKHRNYIAGGLKWEFLKGYSLELSLVENLSPFENSSDIAFSLGFQFRL